MRSMAAVATSLEGLVRTRVFPGSTTRRAASAPPAAEKPTPAPEFSDLEPSIYRFILKHSLPQQIALLLLTLASFPFLYYSLNLPKDIINHAIKDDAKFPQHILGFELERIPFLMLLCAAFLILVFCNGVFKYYINTYKGRLGERMLRRFRYQLYQRLLRFPLTHFQR